MLWLYHTYCSGPAPADTLRPRSGDEATRQELEAALAEKPAATDTAAPAPARETLLNSRGESFAEVLARYKTTHVWDADSEWLFAGLGGVPAPGEEAEVAAYLARLNLRELGAVLRNDITSPALVIEGHAFTVFTNLAFLLRKAPHDDEALLHAFVELLSTEDAYLMHHLFNADAWIQQRLGRPPSVHDDDILRLKYRERAFMRELLLHRWIKPAPSAKDARAPRGPEAADR